MEKSISRKEPVRLTGYLDSVDTEVAELIRKETDRQRTTISLIPSENYTSVAVQLALASSFTNKYAEGYPYVWSKETDSRRQMEKNGRYYQGQLYANGLERLVIERALRLFTPSPDDYHANVQPHSGSPANLAVLHAFLRPGDTFMGLSLAYGGHLTHGHDVNITGMLYRAVQYRLNDRYEMDYDEVERLASKHKPKLIFCGATAYPRVIDFARLGAIARAAGALLVADISHIAGLCITGVHEHPFPHADIVTTTTHKILRGPRAAIIVCKKRYGPAIDRAVFPGLQGGPHMNSLAAMAVAFKEASGEAYQQYAGQVVANAAALAESLRSRGFSLMGGGTDNHLILLDVVHSAPEVRAEHGAKLAARLEKAGIVTNKNAIPGDTKPWYPSGIRLGTPAVTTLGMKEAEMETIGGWITEAAANAEDETALLRIRERVKAFMRSFANADYFIE